MILHTASEVITLSRKLENDSANFYESLARQHAHAAESLLSFAGDNRKNVAQIERAYYGVITDALEGGFAFNIEADKYDPIMAIQNEAGYADILNHAVEIEKKIIKFYTDAADQSKSLMADVPRAFMLIAQKRKTRLVKLDSLLKT